MAFSTYTLNAPSVQAQTITAIGSNLAKGQHGTGYTLADGSFVLKSVVTNRFGGAAYVPQVGDYVVVTGQGHLVVWPATQFLANYTAGGQTVTVQNSAGTVTRAGLAVVGGVVTLAATDALVSNGSTTPLHKSDGTVSAGNATLNSPATFEIANGAVTDVKASA